MIVQPSAAANVLSHVLTHVRPSALPLAIQHVFLPMMVAHPTIPFSIIVYLLTLRPAGGIQIAGVVVIMGVMVIAPVNVHPIVQVPAQRHVPVVQGLVNQDVGADVTIVAVEVAHTTAQGIVAGVEVDAPIVISHKYESDSGIGKDVEGRFL